jgi:HEAT repeat protein
MIISMIKKTVHKVFGCLLIGSLMAPSAMAWSLEGKDNDELIEILANHSRESKREEAARILGERGAQEAVATLGERCPNDSALSVCMASVQALGAIGGQRGNLQLQTLLLNNQIPTQARVEAISLLLPVDPELLTRAIPLLLVHYRALPEEISVPLVDAIASLQLNHLADIPLFISVDTEAPRAVRLAGHHVSELFQHTHLWQSHLALLDDPDTRMRAHCAEALRDLLPTLHTRLSTERHPTAWSAIIDLLGAINNQSSTEPLLSTLSQAERRSVDDMRKILTQIAVLADESRIPQIYALEQNYQGRELAEVCRAATTALAVPINERAAEIARIGATPQPPHRRWDSSVPDAAYAPLSVSIDSRGVLILPQ